MPTFALDTSTASPSLALVRDEEPVAELRLAPEPGAGRRVLEAVHGLLSSVGASVDDIDDIVVGVGPGGFTGLRIGLATALGLGQALGVPVTGASSLEALALGVAELAASMATTWGTSELRIGRTRVTGSAGARRARDTQASVAATARRRLTSASGRRA